MRLVCLILGVACLAGCSQTPAPAVNHKLRAGFAARSDAGLRAGVVELRRVRFKKLDLNQDEQLTRQEASDDALRHPGIIETFADYDTNGDNHITFAEFLHEGVIQWWMAEIRPRIQRMFTKADENRDGMLKGKELDSIKLYFSLFPETHGADLNRDGVVPFSEFEDAYMYTLPKIQPQGPELTLPGR